MNPWLIFWAPQWHLPFSGSLAQQIEPNTNWFFGAIDSQAGNGRIERQAFEVASYGRQLGLITEVLLDAARRAPSDDPAAIESLQRLQAIHDQIERLKADDTETTLSELEAQVKRLRQSAAGRNPQVRRRLQIALDEGS